MTSWTLRLGRHRAILLTLLLALPALARIGGGEHYQGQRDSSDGDGGGGEILFYLVMLAFEHPVCGIPLLLAFCGYLFYRWKTDGDGATSKAIARAEANQRTTVTTQQVTSWVSQLKAKDAAFDLLGLYDGTKKIFLELQQAWFQRDLEPVRRYLSDATFQRLMVQQRLLGAQGVRDAIAGVQVNDLTLIGLEQSQWFDSVHVRVKATMRDADAPAGASDDEALQLAKRTPPSSFIEVWSFVRKPGAQTRPTHALTAGTCPNCGAPFTGGASNRCDHCGAVVNSGQYDWVLAEITQGGEHVRANGAVDGLARVRQSDPALNTEMLEDRASLCFWRWVDAQSSGDVSRLSKVATEPMRTRVQNELDQLKAGGRRKVFLQCAVGAVDSRQLESDGTTERAHVEIRWSAKLGIGPANEKPPTLPVSPQRWVFTLERKAGAKTSTDDGMSTFRCPNCHAPLSDNGDTSCEFCGQLLDGGERDWVLADARMWEGWSAGVQRAAVSAQSRDRVADKEERERLLYMMAAIAAADGRIDPEERQLLRDCANRWGIAWANVELALGAGSTLFDRLVTRGSNEAEAFLRELVQMALIDGKVDRKERKLLETAAAHLGLAEKLPVLLRPR